MSTEAQQQSEFNKNNACRNNYRRALHCSVLLAILAVLLTAVLVYMNIIEKQPAYYATTTNGEVIPMYPLSEPVVTSKYILRWASIATREALNLDFVNYKKQMNKESGYFTSGGWNSFKKALNSSGLLQTVIDKKLQMSAVVSGPAFILNRSIVHGRFTWTIQLPVLITYTSANQQSHSKWIVTIAVQRVPVLNAAKGIQISDFIAQQPIGK